MDLGINRVLFQTNLFFNTFAFRMPSQMHLETWRKRIEEQYKGIKAGTLKSGAADTFYWNFICEQSPGSISSCLIRRKRKIGNASRARARRRSSQPVDIRGASCTYHDVEGQNARWKVSMCEEGVNNLLRHSPPPALFFHLPRRLVNDSSAPRSSTWRRAPFRRCLNAMQ